MKTQSLLIANARVLDPASEMDARGFVSIRDGLIDQVATRAPKGKFDRTIEADKLWLMPGLIDLCARLREPGQTHKATIHSETRAALNGGVTAVCLPPDTQPAIDTPSVVDRIRNRAREVGGLDVHILGALTRALGGETLSEMGALKAAGCVGVSNALARVSDALIARRALEYARTHGLTVHIVPMDASLANGGCAHEGAVATRLGLPGIPAAAETVALAAWLELVEATGARVHFGRLSTARGAELVAQAQSRGLPVTADVAAHQLFLTEDDTAGYENSGRVIPPLRTGQDRDALRKAVKHGSIAAVCSDHQPHEADAKINPFPLAEPGISGIETLLPLTLQLVRERALPLLEAVARVTLNPAEILGTPAGRITPGAPAHLVLIDPEHRWTLRSSEILSAGRCTPFDGWEFRGRVRQTLHAGRVMFSR